MEIKVWSKGNEQCTTSKNVADVFGKTHRDVTRAIAALDCSDEFRVRNFTQSSYLSQQNKRLQCVEMTKNGFAFLCMGFTGKKAAQFKEAYILEFDRMASSLHTISDRVNNLERGRLEIQAQGREWSEIGHEIRRAKKIHQEKETQLLDDVQLKISF